MPWDRLRAMNSIPPPSPLAAPTVAQALEYREGMQGRQNMAWNSSRVTNNAQIPSPLDVPVAMCTQKRRERTQR